MAKYAIMIADGCEEVEALTVVDILRRAGVTLDLVNIHDKDEVTSSHDIIFKTDVRLADINDDDYEGIILPGGLGGTNNLKASDRVKELICKYSSEGKLVSAICAAPTVLGTVGVLKGKKATCYPGCEEELTGANVVFDEVAYDGNIITSRGFGTAIPFGLALAGYICGSDKADEIAEKIVFAHWKG